MGRTDYKGDCHEREALVGGNSKEPVSPPPKKKKYNGHMSLDGAEQKHAQACVLHSMFPTYAASKIVSAPRTETNVVYAIFIYFESHMHTIRVGAPIHNCGNRVVHMYPGRLG